MNRKTGFILVAVSLLLWSTLPGRIYAQEMAPDFTLTDINGTEFSLSDYRGRVVLIDFCRVEPACPPCIAEIPYLKGVYKEYSRSQVIIMSLSVSSSDTDDSIRKNFVEEYDIPWIVACGTSQIADEYGVQYVPTLVIIDQDGYIRYRHVGVTEESDLTSEIESLLLPSITITILSPENRTYAEGSVSLDFQVNVFPSWIGYSLDDEANETIIGNTTLTGLSKGSHNIVVYANDTAGNMGRSDIVYFTIKEPSSLTICLTSSTSYIGFKVGITGGLAYMNGSGISKATLLLEYSVTEGESWNDITSVTTGMDGNYSAQWIPSATGIYLVRTSWPGDKWILGANTSVSLAVTPFQGQYVFSVLSNSTLSELAFNSTSRHLSFFASGASGTTGYVNVTIAKALISDVTDLRVFFDGTELNYQIKSTDSSWLLHFTYNHTTHELIVSLGIEKRQEGWRVPPYAIFVLALIVVGAGLSVVILRRRKIIQTK